MKTKHSKMLFIVGDATSDSNLSFIVGYTIHMKLEHFEMLLNVV